MLSASLLAVNEHSSMFNDAEIRGKGCPFLSSLIPLAPGVVMSSITSNGQYPVGTSSNTSNASTVAEISQMGDKSLDACFCKAAETFKTSPRGICLDSETSASCRMSADMKPSLCFLPNNTTFGR